MTNEALPATPSVERQIALYIIGKLAIEGFFTLKQVNYDLEWAQRTITEALQEALPTYTADGKTSFRQLCDDADLIITQRDLERMQTQ